MGRMTQAAPWRADTKAVLRLRSSRPGLADLLGELPDGFHCVQDGPGWLVIGPTGAFMVGEGHRDPATAGQQLALAAGHFRAAVADALSWAPFVDVLVVAEDHPVVAPAASVVTLEMVVDTLTAGPPMLDEETVARLAELSRPALAHEQRSGTG